MACALHVRCMCVACALHTWCKSVACEVRTLSALLDDAKLGLTDTSVTLLKVVLADAMD